MKSKLNTFLEKVAKYPYFPGVKSAGSTKLCLLELSCGSINNYVLNKCQDSSYYPQDDNFTPKLSVEKLSKAPFSDENFVDALRFRCNAIQILMKPGPTYTTGLIRTVLSADV